MGKRWYNKATVYRLIRLGIIFTIIIMFFVLLLPGTTEWCNASLGAGECEKYMKTSCYCIDAFTSAPNQSDGLFERAQARCSKLDGYLATPDQNSLLIWLSKRLFKMGVDTALVGLTKIASVWTWIKPEGNETAGEILWRKEFPPNDSHAHGTINVKTHEAKIKDNGGYYIYDYIYYNYDYYLYENPSEFKARELNCLQHSVLDYQWFGFSTSNNIHDDENKPASIISNDGGEDNQINEGSEGSLVLSDISDIIQSDPCYCSANEQIKLSELDDSQTFQSPKYPSNYCSDANCRWIIRTPDNLAVRLEWLVFNIETNMDYVYVYDAETDDFRTPLIEACTGSRCKNQISSGNSMQVHFKSDHVTTDLGFKVRVTAVKIDPCYCSPLSVVTLANVGESYQLTSPNQPNPYCQNHNCSWTINAPKNSGLQLVWTKFDTEMPKDKLFIHDGHKLIHKCTGSSCKGVTSFADELHLRFVSDDKESQHSGFSALLVAVQNFCEKNVVQNGIATYSNERSDGNIPMEASVTLKCNHNYWIFLEDSTITDRWKGTCVAPEWSEPFPQCIMACIIHRSTTIEEGSDLYFCDYGDSTKNLIASVPDGYELNVQHHQQGIITNEEVFTCLNSIWHPHKPKCHAIGIVLFGLTFNNIQIYSPVLNDVYFLDMPMPALFRTDHISVALGDGKVMAISYGSDSPRVIDLKTKRTVMINRLIIPRLCMTAAVLNDTVFVCGGQDLVTQMVFTSCEKLRNGHGYWKTTGDMNSGHVYGAMVAMDNALYITGGTNAQGKVVERYDTLPGSWRMVAPMLNRRSQHAATVFNGRLYVCGGIGVVSYDGIPTTCEQYNHNLDEWIEIASVKGPQYSEWSHSLHVFNGKLLAIGGMYGQLEAKYYDTITNSWKEEHYADAYEYQMLGSAIVLPVLSKNNQTEHWNFAATVEEQNQYYCKRNLAVDNGVISYSSIEYIDGLTPIGSSATLTCNEHYDILLNDSTTIHTYSITCEAPNWSERFPPQCMFTACGLSKRTTTENDSDFYFCDHGGSIVAMRENVSSGTELKVQHHQNQTITNEIFVCHNTTWLSRNPICDFVGFLIIGEDMMEAYSPFIDEFAILDMPQEYAGELVDGSLVLADGKVMVFGRFESEAKILDLKTNQITSVARRPTGLSAYIILNNTVFVCGGLDLNNWDEVIMNCEKFIDDGWVQTKNMRYSHLNPAIVAINKDLYITGGERRDECPHLDVVERYDTETDTWKEVAPMLNQRNKHASTAFNGQIIVCGGFQCYEYSIEWLHSCEIYTPSLDQWLEFAPLKQNSWDHISLHVFIGKLWAIGGNEHRSEPAEVQSYDPATNYWTRKARSKRKSYSTTHSTVVLPVVATVP